MSTHYGNDSLSIQSDKDAIRMYPNVHLGSADINGAMQTIKEILSNSVDEAIAGYGNTINLTIHKDGSVTVEDFGRGLPMDYNKNEDKYNWEIALCILHGGGKFKNTKSNSYATETAGQHGIGSSATQLSSEFCTVASKRDGYIYTMHFEKGEPVGKLSKVKDSDGKVSQITGTTFTWKPDIEVFTDIDFDINSIVEWVKLQAIANKNIYFNVIDERNSYNNTFYYEHGIYDYAAELISSSTNTSDHNIVLSELIKINGSGVGRDTIKRPTYEVCSNIVFSFCNTPTTMYFHNGLHLEYGGSPKHAMEDAFTQFFTTALKKKGILKSKELKFDDIKENLLFICATTTQVPPSFENQTKKAISNKFIQEFLTSQILNKLTEWSSTATLEFDKVCEQISINNESRNAAISHRAITKQKLTKNLNGMKNKIPNYVDCRSKDVTKKELYIAEGTSALSALKQARDPETQALMPIRGKIKSVYKVKQTDALNSELIKHLIQLIGTNINTKTTKCDVSAINFDKIIFATDADQDARHIVSLLLTLFYTFMPEVIEAGHVYHLKTPLYEIFYKDGTEALAYDDDEKEALIKNKQVKHINRNKGLGEIDAHMMKICLDPNTRQLVQFTLKDAELAKQYMDLFMGADSSVRKEYIEEHMHEYDLTEILE